MGDAMRRILANPGDEEQTGLFQGAHDIEIRIAGE
jgi:hypothetical protein